MARDTRVIVDTDIIIKIFRGDKDKREVLEPIQNDLGMSVVTAMELLNGANSRKREYEVLKVIKAYNLFPITPNVGAKAFQLIKKYHLHHATSVADAQIASTAIKNDLQLYTDNLNDYSFILS